MADKKLKIVIDAVDNTSGVLKEIGSNLNKTEANFEKLNDGFKTIGKVALAAGAGLLAFATKTAFSSARVDELALALNAIAKANKITQKSVDSTVKKLRSFNIAHDKALQITSLFIQSNKTI